MINIQTNKNQEIIDITKKIETYLKEKNISDGILFLKCPHTTAGVFINESHDSDVASDILDTLEKLIPSHEQYKHLEGNAHAHIKSSLLGSSEIIFIENGKLKLGTWQGIFFAEFDGPRKRKLDVKFLEKPI